jgi:hypothetical protein
MRPTGTASPTRSRRTRRRFALLGVYGQSIFVDPERKPALVITGAAKNASVGKAPFASERDARRRGIVGRYGSW